MRCTQKFYQNLTTKDQDTLYFVYEPNNADNGFLYLGNRLIFGQNKTEHEGDVSIYDIQEIILSEGLSDGSILLYNEAKKVWENHDLKDLLTYSSFVGATEDQDGIAGLVPVPEAGDQFKFLMGDGTWQEIDTYDDELHAVTKTLVGDDPNLSAREIAEDVVIDLRESVKNLQDLLDGSGSDSDIGLRARVKSLEDSVGDFHPVESKYLNIGEAVDYFDVSITSINDRLRWHNV